MPDAGEYFRSLYLDGLQGVRVEPEELQDRRGDLRRLDRRVNSRRRNGARRVDDDRNILVSGVVAAVLGDGAETSPGEKLAHQ